MAGIVLIPGSVENASVARYKQQAESTRSAAGERRHVKGEARMNINVAGLGALAVLAFIWSIIVTIFWMVVGWRAMRAHEEIANVVTFGAAQSPERLKPAPGTKGVPGST
jgi:uncharacterized membrane protein